ncbi:hypothetical protein DAPPUDRAFT_120689 [Daphnia pulex]|uniref:Uncharacterized protein n=1 Tax=Daphnia pulex TaxID=6669 RepID=E9I201_DAPPU|nr:hypothetical protein DAPPUDRAFT_120689 [Daphnia pulex]|eukprot:EFX61979.1 hypothetical protein DAPPUDRAFT_120689 [Daphnia pulex]
MDPPYESHKTPKRSISTFGTPAELRYTNNMTSLINIIWCSMIRYRSKNSLITLHEADPEDEDPLHIDDLYYDDVSSVDSGSTEPNPDLQLNFALDEKAVSPLPSGLPNNECSGEAEQMYAPPIFLRSEEEYQQNRKELINQYNRDSRKLYRRFYSQAQQLKRARKRIYSS